MYELNISETITCSMFGRMRQTQGWETTEKRYAPSNIFVFMINGKAEFNIENKKVEIENGDILIIPKGTIYNARTEDFCEYYFFHFSGHITKDENKSEYITNTAFSFNLTECKHDYVYFESKTSNKDVYNKIYKCIINCIECISVRTRTGRIMTDVEFLKIMLILGDAYENKNYELPPVLEKMIAYIRTNLTKPLSLKDISSYCEISASYAARLFKKHLNISASSYINGEKLRYSCELMKNTNMNITEISDYLGYCDVYYFSRLFKRKFGVSPSQYH